MVLFSVQPLLSEPDRALHAALAPSPATSIVLKSACRTWHDHLWAQISVVCEGKQVDALAQVIGGGGYWEGGLESVERIAAETTLQSSRETEEKRRKEEAAEEREWELEVVDALESLKHVGVSEG